MSRQHSRMARRRAGRRAFSLTEVLLAVFILGIGVIAIAALFPAGIAQQQQSADDVIGPIVANNALSVLRTKLRADDFGTFEEHGYAPPMYTIEGDWPWLRPAFIFPIAPAYPDGAIDVFNATDLAAANEYDAGNSGDFPWGIPYNVLRSPGGPPVVVFTQAERFYPMSPGTDPTVNEILGTPQYVWDCMFRRFQGRILVAVFVYRVTIPGGSGVPYTLAPLPAPYENDPPLPFRLALDPADPNSPPSLSQYVVEQMWDADGIVFIEGTENALAYDATNLLESWQEPRQWLLDQNSTMHRVLSRTRPAVSGDPMQVELVRPVPLVPSLPAYYLPAASGSPGVDVVSHLWYIPTDIKVDLNGDAIPDELHLTPVYATVKEL